MSKKRDLSPIGQILLIVGLMLGGFLLNLLVSLVGIIPFKGLGGFNEIVSNPSENVALLKLLQTLQSICLFIIPAYIYAHILSGNYKSFFLFKRSLNQRTALIIIISIIAAIPFINLLGELNTKMVLPESLSFIEEWMKMAEERAASTTALLVSGKGIFALLINLVMIAVLPAIGEEMIFRGVFQRIFLKSFQNMHVAVLLSAFFFSAFHLQFYGFLPRFFIGILLGYLYMASGNIWLPILAHFINNAVATIFYYLFNNGIITEDLDQLGTGSGWTMGVLSAGMLLIIYFYLERNKIVLQLDEFKSTSRS